MITKSTWVIWFGLTIFSLPLSVNAEFNKKGLVAAWLFDDGKGKVAKDSSGNELHAEVDKGKAKLISGSMT